MNPASARVGLRAGLALAGMVFAAAAAAQGRSAGGDREYDRLRQAATFEGAGRYMAAEELLRAILANNPTSLSAVISLERVLALQHRSAELLPVLDTLLRHESTSVVGHQMRIRTLSLLNDETRLREAANEWIRASPKIETPYREVARVWRSRGSLQDAIEVLELGRARVGRRDALALELGDAWAAAGDMQRVVREWSRAVGSQGEAFLLVQRRLANLPAAGAPVIPGLVDALVSKPTTPSRMRAAVQLAVDTGLREEAERISNTLLSQLGPEERRGFLVELGRRADGAGLRRLALWAYGRLVTEGGRNELMLPLRSRMAELALAVGDTLRASQAYRELENELAPGSPERRQAMLLRVQMLVRDDAFDSAHVELDRLAMEAGSATETDLAAAVLANRLIDVGRLPDALSVLAARSGPHATFARGRAFMASGDADRARSEILAAAPHLEGGQATEALALATLLGKLSDAGGGLMGRALAAIAAGDRRKGVMLLYDGSDALPAGERAAILDYAAGLADRTGLHAEADQIRTDLVADAPQSPEAPLALLALARRHLERNAGTEARQLLERLLLDYPRSALAPQARRELDRLAAPRDEIADVHS